MTNTFLHLCIPQRDTPENREKRAAEVRAVRAKVTFTDGGSFPANNVALPKRFGIGWWTPGFSWTSNLVQVKMLLGSGVYAGAYFTTTSLKVAWSWCVKLPVLKLIFGRRSKDLPPPDPVLGRYETIFTEAQIRQMPFKGQMTTDEAFAAQRLGGSAPQFLKKISTLADMPTYAAITDANVTDVVEGGEKLATLASQGRLFVCDYYEVGKGILEQDAASVAALKQIGWKAEPVAYFYVVRGGAGGKDRLMPLAIQLLPNLKPGSLPNPVFTPRSKSELWLAAKLFVNHAECILHTGTMHVALGVFISPMAYAMTSTMSSRHPINNLMQPFMGCGAAFPNVIDTPLLPVATWKLAARKNAFKIWSWDRMRPRGLFAYLGTTRGECAITDEMYPYRKYLIAIWDEIERLVTEVVDSIYQTDDVMRNDTELQNWAAMLADPKQGNFQWGPIDRSGKVGRFTEKKQLIDIVTMFCFLPSLLGFDTLNSGWYAFTPTFPVSFTLDPPRSLDANLTFDDVVAALPGPTSMDAIASKATIFGAVSMGDCSHLTTGGPQPHFRPRPAVFLEGSLAERAAPAFFARLAELDAEERRFNAEIAKQGYQPLEALLPTKIYSCLWV